MRRECVTWLAVVVDANAHSNVKRHTTRGEDVDILISLEFFNGNKICYGFDLSTSALFALLCCGGYLRNECLNI